MTPTRIAGSKGRSACPTLQPPVTELSRRRRTRIRRTSPIGSPTVGSRYPCIGRWRDSAIEHRRIFEARSVLSSHRRNRCCRRHIPRRGRSCHRRRRPASRSHRWRRTRRHRRCFRHHTARPRSGTHRRIRGRGLYRNRCKTPSPEARTPLPRYCSLGRRHNTRVRSSKSSRPHRSSCHPHTARARSRNRRRTPCPGTCRHPCTRRYQEARRLRRRGC